MVEVSSSPQSPGPAKGFLRSNWAVMTGITAVIATVGFPLVAVVRNNEAEYQATGDFGALFGHPFDRSTHAAFKSMDYAALVAQHPDLKFSPDDSPEIRAIKIGAINAKLKAKLEGEIEATQIIPRAQETAAAQAKAQMLVQAQANVDVMEDSAAAETTAEAAVLTQLNSQSFAVKSPIEAKLIDPATAIKMQYKLVLPQNWKLEDKDSPPGYLSIQLRQYKLVEALGAASIQMPAGDFTPFVDPKGKAVWTTDAHETKFVPGMMDGRAYFVPLSDYENLGGPPPAPAYKAHPQ